MQKAISAAAYAKHCGLDINLVKKYCNSGIIPHVRNGAFYRIWPDKADDALNKYINKNMEQLKTKSETKKQEIKQSKPTPAVSITNGNDFIQTINNLLKTQKGGTSA
ncbi:hypothetical protein [Pectinatus frisingensis]|uniref:hypothetical protein n=1 Tax=Pectinatus frisingensis TaxID=865 RepID=UPI0018C799F2|nr:hypothetical protein [Pectinatus frisingensis]